jgi:hypothetical protein
MAGSVSRKASLTMEGRLALSGFSGSKKKNISRVSNASAKSLGGMSGVSAVTTSSLRSEAKATAGGRGRDHIATPALSRVLFLSSCVRYLVRLKPAAQ